jgi:hypothetical protein
MDMYELTIANDVALNDWLSTINVGRPESTYQGSYDVPFQRWFKFKEAFSPLLVKRLIEESPIPVKRCLDVFGGCGTTGVTSVFMGVQPSVIEVNPFLVDVIRAKLGRYEASQVRQAYPLWVRHARELERSGIAFPMHLPETFVERSGADSWIYPQPVLRRILAYRYALKDVRDPGMRVLFKVLLASVLVEVSNVLVSGKGRKYRKNWEGQQKSARDVDAALERRLLDVIHDLARFKGRPAIEPQLLHGDARVRLGEIAPCDSAISSPPYPNSFDYTDIYNLELWVLGYIRSRSAETTLRHTVLRSHVQRKLLHTSCTDSPTLNRIVRRLRAERDELWNPRIPEMVESYFSDLQLILRKLQRVVRKNGHVSLIVADSAYAGITVKVGEILAELGEELGYRVVDLEQLRLIKSSAQQGWRRNLKEELVRLQRC